MDPQSIKIPALGIDQDLTELGVIGTDLQVPDDYFDVGWWRDGPIPGEDGAAVMVGHVDSPTGPAVFYQLSGLQQGNEIVIGQEDGSRTVFAVRRVQAYERTQFPSTEVYRTHGKPALHLLTCGGSFDTDAGRYTGNVVVYADLVDRIPPLTDEPHWYKHLVEDTRRKVAQGQQEDRWADKPSWYPRLVQDNWERPEQQSSERQ